MSRHYLSEHYKNGEQTSGTSEMGDHCWVGSEDQQPQERTTE